MNHSIKNPLIRGIASVKLTLVILAVFAVAIAVATFLEVRHGTDGARILVYDALWFEVLLGLLVVNLVASLILHIPFHVRQTGFVITHIGFIVVLIAAGITRYLGYEGSMSIREGSSTDHLYSARDYIRLTSGGESASFPLRLYKAGRQSLSRHVEVGGERFRVSVREYWPNFEMQLSDGPGGEPAIVFRTSGRGAHDHDETLNVGEEFEMASVTIHFVAGDKTADVGGGYGELLVEIGGDTHRLDVPREPPAEISVAGYRFRITEFTPNFRVGETSAPSDPMRNPAIRVAVEGPGGAEGERLLFALHPDFDMGHSGKQAAFEEIEMRYNLMRNVYLFMDGERLAGRADCRIQIGPPEGAARSVEPGARFDVAAGDLIDSGDFAISFREVWASATEQPVVSADKDRPSAVRLAVEDAGGRAGETIVEKYGDRAMIALGDREIALDYGPQRIALPYRLHLDDFLLITYPGSNNPASFESHVRIFDEERDVAGEPVRIYMNHPLTYRGFKHFQSSYDRDRRGTILSVNHDPGKLPTYFGYLLVGVGFLITLTRGMWYRRPTA